MYATPKLRIFSILGWRCANLSLKETTKIGRCREVQLFGNLLDSEARTAQKKFCLHSNRSIYPVACRCATRLKD